MSNLGEGGLAGVDLKPFRGRVTECQRVQETCEAEADDRTRAHQRARRRETLSLLLTCSLLASVAGNIWLGTQGVREIPYVVLVDHLGREQPLVREDKLTLAPEQGVVLDVLKDWIEHARWMSHDHRALAKNWDWLRAYTTPAGLRQLEGFQQEQVARQHLGRRVDVKDVSVLPITDQPHAYTIAWREEAYDKNGQLLLTESLLGEGTIVVAAFQKQAAKEARSLLRKKKIYRNMRGIFVHEVGWKFRPLPAPTKPATPEVKP